MEASSQLAVSSRSLRNRLLKLRVESFRYFAAGSPVSAFFFVCLFSISSLAQLSGLERESEKGTSIKSRGRGFKFELQGRTVAQARLDCDIRIEVAGAAEVQQSRQADETQIVPATRSRYHLNKFPVQRESGYLCVC